LISLFVFRCAIQNTVSTLSALIVKLI